MYWKLRLFKCNAYNYVYSNIFLELLHHWLGQIYCDYCPTPNNHTIHYQLQLTPYNNLLALKCVVQCLHSTNDALEVKSFSICMVSIFASYWSIGSRLWTLGSSSNCDYEKKDLNLFKIVRRSTPISFNSNSTSYYYNNEVNMKSWRLCNSPMRKKNS